MRAFAIASIFLSSCSVAVAPSPAAHVAPRLVIPEPDRAPVDPIAALTPSDAAERSWAIPGPIQLELGGEVIGALGSDRPIEVAAIDQQGNLERVALRLE